MRKIIKMCLLILVALIAKPTMAQRNISSVIAANSSYKSFFTCEQEYTKIIGAADESLTNFKLLIICAEKFVDDIKAYANYKMYQGYEVALVSVKVKSNSGSYINSDILHSFLRDGISKRKEKSDPLRPNYVLLVGSTYDLSRSNWVSGDCFIPFHGNPDGDVDRVYNPANDFTYSIKDGSIENGLLYHIGRFNVNNDTCDVKDVIYNTMSSEQNYQHNKKHILKITGDGKTEYAALLTGLLGIPHDEMRFSSLVLDFNIFDGVNETHLNHPKKKEFNETIKMRKWWMIIYNGHGGVTSTYPCEENVIETDEGIKAEGYCRLGKDNYKKDDCFPIMFVQACKTGAYSTVSFGYDAAKYCASAFIGASTTAGARWGQLLLQKAFKKDGNAWSKQVHIGDFLDDAKKQAFDKRNHDIKMSGWSDPWDGCKRFNLFGDPSLIIKGYNCTEIKLLNETYTSSNKMFYKVYKTIDTNNSQVIAKEGSEITFIAGEKIILKPGFKIEKGSTFNATIQSELKDKKNEYEKNNNL